MIFHLKADPNLPLAIAGALQDAAIAFGDQRTSTPSEPLVEETAGGQHRVLGYLLVATASLGYADASGATPVFAVTPFDRMEHLGLPSLTRDDVADDFYRWRFVYSLDKESSSGDLASVLDAFARFRNGLGGLVGEADPQGSLPLQDTSMDRAVSELVDLLGWVLYQRRDELEARLTVVTGERDAALRRIDALEAQLRTLRASQADPNNTVRIAVISAAALIVSSLISGTFLAATSHYDREQRTELAATSPAKTADYANLEDLDSAAQRVIDACANPSP